MDICYNLSDEEVLKIQFFIRYITDRQDRPSYFRPGMGTFVQSYAGHHRRDMFWIECTLNDTELGSLSVEPNLQDSNKFDLRKNHNKVGKGYTLMILKAHVWFMSTSEYQQQVKWTQQLAEKIEKDVKSNFQDTIVQ